jgi:hypothetical protein
MISMRLELETEMARFHEDKERVDDSDAPLNYPTPRYFQVHFQYLYELIESLTKQIQEANRQIAAQNELMQNLRQESDSRYCLVCKRVETLCMTAEASPIKKDQSAEQVAEYS